MVPFPAAPGLETLYAISASSSYEQYFWAADEAWTLRLTGLRKLTITDIEPLGDLELLLGCCPALSELHFSLIHCDEYWNMAHLIGALTPVKRQPRRLTLTWVPRDNNSDPEDPESCLYEWAMGLGKQLNTVDRSREFENLEALAVDQAALCHLEDRLIPSDRHVDSLPVSIREVHFYVYRPFLAALEILACEPPRWFPHLRVVHISIADRVEVHRAKGLEENRCFTSIARDVRIEVRWSTTQIGELPWAAAPGLCPGSKITPFFSSYKLASYVR